MDKVTEHKWDRAALSYDLMSRFGPERRWAPAKRELFSHMRGPRILFLAAGSGLDFPFFPPGLEIDAIDISARMLEQAQPRAAAYSGTIRLQHMDVHDMSFADGEFDQVFTSCTFCSVPDPVAGLRALRRVLKPGGELYMFEHTGSRYFPFKLMLKLMTPLSQRFGPAMDRDTVSNVDKAGFELQWLKPVYLDVVNTLCARNPAQPQDV